MSNGFGLLVCLDCGGWTFYRRLLEADRFVKQHRVCQGLVVIARGPSTRREVKR